MNIVQLVQRHRFGFIIGVFGILMGVWALWIIPMFGKIQKLHTQMEQTEEELRGIKDLAGKIKSLEGQLGSAKDNLNQESMLKQVERIAQTTKIYHGVERLSPIQRNNREGLLVECKSISMNDLIPFMEEITYRSLLEISEVDIRASQKSGLVDARLTVMEVTGR